MDSSSVLGGVPVRSTALERFGSRVKTAKTGNAASKVAVRHVSPLTLMWSAVCCWDWRVRSGASCTELAVPGEARRHLSDYGDSDCG